MVPFLSAAALPSALLACMCPCLRPLRPRSTCHEIGRDQWLRRVPPAPPHCMLSPSVSLTCIPSPPLSVVLGSPFPSVPCLRSYTLLPFLRASSRPCLMSLCMGLLIGESHCRFPARANALSKIVLILIPSSPLSAMLRNPFFAVLVT